MSVKNQNRMANSVDPNEMAHYEPSYQGLHCLHRYLFWFVKLKVLYNNNIVTAKITYSCGASKWFLLEFLNLYLLLPLPDDDVWPVPEKSIPNLTKQKEQQNMQWREKADKLQATDAVEQKQNDKKDK